MPCNYTRGSLQPPAHVPQPRSHGSSFHASLSRLRLLLSYSWDTNQDFQGVGAQPLLCRSNSATQAVAFIQAPHRQPRLLGPCFHGTWYCDRPHDSCMQLQKLRCVAYEHDSGDELAPSLIKHEGALPFVISAPPILFFLSGFGTISHRSIAYFQHERREARPRGQGRPRP
jgi:hypothetical protein